MDGAGTNNEFGFDYLRDNMVHDLADRVQRPLHYAIVDEVDNILIDEARTPLIISGVAEESADLYRTFAKLVTQYELDVDFTVDLKQRTASLTDSGINKVEERLKLDNIYAEGNYQNLHYLKQALRGHALYTRAQDYVLFRPSRPRKMCKSRARPARWPRSPTRISFAFTKSSPG